eukprot:7600748-Pyramimonas_sp.AAC.1
MSEAQKNHDAAGQRLCRKCAEDREKAVLRTSDEAENRKRKAKAEAEPLTCCAPGCGVSFWEVGHLSRNR